MRRLFVEVTDYLSDLWRATIRGWNVFFFAPADPTALGLIRIAVGMLALWSLFVFGLDLHDYFSSTGWAEPGLIRSVEGPLTWSFWFLVPDAWLRPVWCVCLVILASFTLGLYSRVTAVFAWIIVVSTVRRVPIALHGFDQVLSTLALYLALPGASGQAVSLDRFRHRWRQARARALQTVKRGGSTGQRVTPDEPGRPVPTVSANLALRLIQLHLVIIYGMAGLAKLQGPSWWDGTAIWKTMATGEFVTLNFTALAAWPVLINVVTHASLALELAYPVLVWGKRIRPIMIAGMVVLHVGIAVMSPGLTEFALVMIAANLAFLSGTWLRGLAIGPSQPALRVLYDGGCPRCRVSIALLSAADPDHVVEPIDLTTADAGKVHPSLTREECMRSMHAVSASGRISRGFDAVRALAAALPLFWPLAAIGHVPGVAWAGRRVYNKAAATRSRDVACTDLVCGIHSRSPLTVPRERGRAQEHHNTMMTTTDTEEAPRS